MNTSTRKLRRLLSVSALAVGTATVGSLALASQAAATITPTDTAATVAAALNNNATLGTPSFSTVPPRDEVGDPFANATSDTALTGFPTHLTTYAIMTSGDPLLADDPNDDGGSGFDHGFGPVHGDSAYDVSVLQLPYTAPAGSTCLQFDFRFLSEEYPEYVGTEFNDAFLAEVATGSNWTTTESDIVAPNNFIVDEQGNPVTINSTGSVTVSPENATGTTYDAATRKLRISKPINPGPLNLHLSILDQGDGILDAAAFVDNLTISSGACNPGSVPIDTPGDTPPGGGAAANPDGTVTVDLPPDPDPGASYVCQVDNADDPDDAPPYEPCTDGQVLGPFDEGNWTLNIAKLGPDGTPDNSPSSVIFCVGACSPPPAQQTTQPVPSAAGPTGLQAEALKKCKKKKTAKAKKKCRKKAKQLPL